MEYTKCFCGATIESCGNGWTHSHMHDNRFDHAASPVKLPEPTPPTETPICNSESGSGFTCALDKGHEGPCHSNPSTDNYTWWINYAEPAAAPTERVETSQSDYLTIDCPKCGRMRVQTNGVCEKCQHQADPCKMTDSQYEDYIYGLSDKMELLIHNIIRDVAEIPDRNSPDDWPEAMIVTDKELGDILRERLAAVAPSPAPAGQPTIIERDLAMLIIRMYAKVKQGKDVKPLLDDAMGYLVRKNLQGGILR